MFCGNCGTKIEEGVKFCPNCGTKVEAAPVAAPVVEAPVVEEPVAQEAAPVVPEVSPEPAPVVAPVVAPEPIPAPIPVEAPAKDTSTSALVMGILSIAFCWSGILNLISIIFGAIGLSKAKTYFLGFGRYNGKAKTGKILSTIGLIVSIVVLVLAVLAIVAVIILWINYGDEFVSWLERTFRELPKGDIHIYH